MYKSLTVTNDCGANTGAQSFTVSSILTVSVNATDASCFGSGNGTASVNIFGGLAPFPVVWSGPNNFVSSEASLTGLEIGEYSVEVIDAANNVVFSIIDISQPTAIVINSSFIINDANNQNIGGVNVADRWR
ncbi:MAG: SprB repeat-containing protein [Saprospiraceae bacterium]|nr:SprB repeat-containing protein [Saprospiraceae bacterium]